MEGITITTAAAEYELYPITFQSYNARGEGDYENGFQPEYTIDEDSPNGNNIYEGYGDFGTANDPLYAYAVKFITGTSYAESTTRSISHTATGQPLAKPAMKRMGMIK